MHVQGCSFENQIGAITAQSIDLMHWRHVSITTTSCWGSRLVALRAHVVLAEHIGAQPLSKDCIIQYSVFASESVRGPGPARRYSMQRLARWLHAWRWRTWQCLIWPPTRGGALLWRHMHMWPCITKPTKSCMAQFCVMTRNRWSGSAWVIFRFWYILKEQSFFYISLKFGSIKRIISKVFCYFSRPIFLPSVVAMIITLVLSFPYKLDYRAYFEPL